MTGLDKLLSAFDVEVDPFAICDVRQGWRLDLAGQGCVTVHYALQGAGLLRLGDGAPVPFEPNTIILIPRGMTQSIATRDAKRSCPADETTCVSLSEGLRWLQAGDGAPDIVMACGRVRATYGEGTGVFDLLDRPIVESFPAGHAIQHAFKALLSEMSERRLGSTALAEALMKQCLIFALRRLAERRDARLPWLRVMENPRLNAAIDSMMTHPEREISVEELAALAGMSRSSFGTHFARAFGRSPHSFLIESRLRRAAHFLQTTDLPVKTIAGKIGYRSRSNFSHAFKALYGVDPNAYRHNAE
jgi:AraC-like DNA-binding protein